MGIFIEIERQDVQFGSFSEKKGYACKLAAVFAVAMLLLSCSTVGDSGLFRKRYNIEKACIKEYMLSTSDEVARVIKDEFSQAGIQTVSYSMLKPAGCEYAVSYEIKREWEPAPYLAFVEMKMLKNEEEIAKVTYEYDKAFLKLPFSKWSSTKKTVKPLVKKLLRQVGY